MTKDILVPPIMVSRDVNLNSMPTMWKTFSWLIFWVHDAATRMTSNFGISHCCAWWNLIIVVNGRDNFKNEVTDNNNIIELV